MKKLIIFSLFLIFLLSGCVSRAGVARTENFRELDIKDEFCGIHINFQYCKCAFHGKYCKEIGMSKKEAQKYLDEEYEKWLTADRQTFADHCEKNNGYMENGACNYCDSGFTASNDECLEGEEAVGVKDDEESEEIKLPEGPYNEDCSLKKDEFDRDWKKYSDIDQAVAPEARSFEAKEALTAYETMIGKLTESFELSRDMEIEEESQAVLNEYRQALVMNQKENLLKAFWRLSWVTYSTIKSGTTAGKSFGSLMTSSGNAVQSIASGLKTFQAVIPANSDLAIDKSKLTGQAMIVGSKTALEAFESLGDPSKVAARFMKSSFDVSMPSANITEEEINILKQQQIDKGVVDRALAASQAENAARQAKLTALEQEIKILEGKISEWEGKEKERVASVLVGSCQKQINKIPAPAE
jgi:hypothetical protein